VYLFSLIYHKIVFYAVVHGYKLDMNINQFIHGFWVWQITKICHSPPEWEWLAYINERLKTGSFEQFGW